MPWLPATTLSLPRFAPVDYHTCKHLVMSCIIMQLMRLSHGAGPVHPATLPLGTLEEAVYKRQIYKQQQSNMVMDGVQEPRYWEGVQVRQMVPAQHLHQLEASVFGSRAGCCMLQHSQLVPDENWQQAAHPGHHHLSA